MGQGGFGQCEAEILNNCPEESWFLRYIRRQTFGSFFEESLEQLLECAGLRNLARLEGGKKNIHKVKKQYEE